MQGICKLCKAEAQLKESHFIPKFVGKWVKKTGVTGYVRDSNEVHKRAQDIAKEYWLCGGCEELFSKWERDFANKIFYPFSDGGECIASYGDWMVRFCASLSWRTLTYVRSKNTNEKNSKEHNDLLNKAEDHIGNFLLGYEKNLNQYEQHVFPLERIESTSLLGLPPNINRYFLRTMQMDIIGNSTETYIYTKLPNFIVMGIVKAKEPQKMRSSRIALKSGTIRPRQYWWPDGFISYLIEKAEAVTNAYNKIPQQHKDSFNEFILKNPEKAAKSKLFEAFKYDHEQFGNKVFSKKD